MSVADVVDQAIELPVVTSFTRLGYEARSRLERWTPLEDYDLEGRVMVVTGATSGLGRAAADRLARCGATLVLVGRDHGRNESVVAEMIDATGNAAISQIAADMGDYDLVRTLARQVLRDHDRLDVLIQNAGALSETRQEAPDGTEATIASQVVGPFVLTGLLLDRLVASSGRVLTMSSGGMYTASTPRTSALQMPPETYKGATQYARAKRVQVVLNELWAERFGHRGIRFHSLHPGWVDTPGIDASLPVFSKVMGPFLRSAEQGSDTLVWLAADDAALESNGKFWFDRRPRRTHVLRSTRASDTVARRLQLWRWVVDASGCDPSA